MNTSYVPVSRARGFALGGLVLAVAALLLIVSAVAAVRARRNHH